MTPGPPQVLFLCVHNAGRSQMAAALLTRYGQDRIVVRSAGSHPGPTLNPAVVTAMAEVGIDISAQRPTRLTDHMARRSDLIVTMGCGDACPVYPGKRYVDWEVPDPADKPLEEVRLIRDEIDTRVRGLLAELTLALGSSGQDAPVQVRRLGSGEWTIVRAVRLRALRESPDAFASSHEEEVGHPDTWWIDGTARLAWFVARDEGRVVGIVAGMPSGDSPEVVSMWVEPGRRGTGVADSLLAAVVAWARAEGAAGLRLAVAEGNQRARRFYERAGFVATGPGEALRSHPDICTTEMRLDLGEGTG